MRADELKRAAAFEAVERCLTSGMIVGLGTGTTAFWAVKRIGELLSSGELRDVRGIPTSEQTAKLAQNSGIPLVSLAEARPDITIDGADEISPALDVLKGRGGALLREKIVASAGETLIIIADDTKLVETLGGGPLPVEVEPFGWEATLDALASLGCEPELRMAGGELFLTDGGHYTADCVFPAIPDPARLETRIRSVPGALECGLFVGLARKAFVAHESGVEVLEAG